jgi:hypothetical protein
MVTGVNVPENALVREAESAGKGALSITRGQGGVVGRPDEY